MISQKCPKCLSSRVRRGYRPTPFWSKILFRYNLLCDNCNWEFAGFAVPGTVSAKPTRNPKKKAGAKIVESSNNFDEPVQALRENSAANHIISESPADKTGAVDKKAAEEANKGEKNVAEEISAVEKTTDAPVSLKAASKKKAKRKSGV